MPSPANVLKSKTFAISWRKWPRMQSGKDLRVAQVTPGRTFESRYFPPECWAELEVFCPEMLVGSAADLRWLAEKITAGEIALTSVNHSVFVVTTVGDTPADDVLRVVLWQAFGVPVYEVFTGGDGMVLAAECEAQDGWHVESGCRFYPAGGQELVFDSPRVQSVRTGLQGTVEQSTCACGRTGARLLDVRPWAAAKSKLLLAAIA